MAMGVDVAIVAVVSAAAIALHAGLDRPARPGQNAEMIELFALGIAQLGHVPRFVDARLGDAIIHHLALVIGQRRHP